jgi:hypothetical protein
VPLHRFQRQHDEMSRSGVPRRVELPLDPSADDAHATALKTTKPPPAPVPQTRLGRFARMGMAVGELAAGAAAQGLKRMARGEAPDFRGALLSAPNAKRLAQRPARLRGAALKIGQLVSMQREDLLPPEFAQALSVLRSQAAPMPPQQLHRVLGREYGAGWERRFSAFDHEPLAAASIGQVHCATTAHGRRVALGVWIGMPCCRSRSPR